MNGPDLRMLADRASAIEDRTPDRLADVHARVAVVRRRRRVAAVATAAAAILVVLLASVVLVAVDPTQRTPDPAPIPPDPQANHDVHRPAEGTCWAVPVKLIEDLRHDDSPQVPCTQEHTTETVVVLNLAEPTAAEAEKMAFEMCWDYVRNHLGVDGNSWVPYTWVAFLPSPAQIEDGASWLRCDAVFPTSLGWPGVRPTTGHAAGVADDPPVELWACFDEAPVPNETPLVPCDRPHAFEETGRLATTFGLAEYPNAQQRAQAETNCDKGVPSWLTGLEVDAAWMPRSTFAPGGNLDAICYVHDPGGGLLPPVRPEQLKGATS